MSDKPNTGTSIPPLPGTGTMVPPTGGGTGTQIPPKPGTGTAIPPKSGTGTAIPPKGGTGTSVAPGVSGTSTSVGSTAMIPEYPEYVMRGIRYRVLNAETAKTLSKKSGEAKIFVVENGGRKFVIKLYIPGHSPNHQILDKIKQAHGGFLIALHDHGRWNDPQHPGLTLDYEIMDYAPYGSLADLRLRGDEKLFRDTAWRMAFCIKQCHDLGIVHRDIKPENFLFTDAARTKFVITDFGIAREIRGDKPVKVDTAKSSYFVSPEGSMSSIDRTTYISRATDWYSMGMTLLALWIGLDNFYALFPYDQLEELDRLKLNNRVIREIGVKQLKLSDYSRSLLERLLEAGDASRADFDEIKRWYEGETLKTGAAAEARTATGAFNVTFDETKGKVARSREELAAMMMADREFAKSFIYRGMAKNALQSTFPRLAAEIDDIPQRLYPRPEEQDAGVYAACLLLDPEIPFFGRKKKMCVTPAEIAADLTADMDYYKEELAKKASPLWVFLHMRGGDVKDFPERFQPIVARSGMHGVFALARALDPTTPLLHKGKAIKNLKELAACIWDNRVALSKGLANPDHSIYLVMAEAGPKAAQLAKIYPAKIKNGGEKELYALCMALDGSMPFPGKDGKDVHGELALGHELWDHFSDYLKEVNAPDHMLWHYLRSWGGSWVKIADSYPSLIAQQGERWLFDLCYRLDSTLPFTVQSRDGESGWKPVRSFDEIIDFARKNGLSKLSIETMTRPHFITWLLLSKKEEDRKRGALLEQMVQKDGSRASKRGAYYLYTLVPDCGPYFSVIGDTPAHLGELILAEHFGAVSTSSMAAGLVCDFDNSVLHEYLEARKLTSYIPGIKAIMDVDANRKAHPSAPYDTDIAVYKVCQYLGGMPSFWKLSGRRLDTLDQFKTLDTSTRNRLCNMGADKWLTMFFHERKGATFSFQELERYFSFIETWCPGYNGLKNSVSRRNAINEAIDNRNKAWRSLRTTRMVAIILALLPMVVLIGWMIGTAMSSADTLSEAFKGIGHVIGIGTAIIGGIATLGDSGNLIAAAIAALICYWVPYWIFSLLSGIAPFILIAILVIPAIILIVKMNKTAKDTAIPSRTDYDNLVTQARMCIVTSGLGTYNNTFGTRAVDPAGTFNNSENIATSQRKAVRRSALWMVLLSIVTLVIGIFLYKEVDQVENGTNDRITIESNVPAELTGEWSGIFHGREATLNMTSGTRGKVTIQYSTPMTQSVQVQSYVPQTGHLILDVMESYGATGATYDGTVYQMDGYRSYMGTYTNPVKGTSHEFEFKLQ